MEGFQTGPRAHPASYTMGIRGSFPGGKVIGCECDHALHLVPSLRMDKTSSYTLMSRTETNLLFVRKKSLQQFHIKHKRVLKYLAAILVRSFTYIEIDTNYNWSNTFSSIINHKCVHFTTTASTGNSSHRKPATAKNIGQYIQKNQRDAAWQYVYL